MSNCNCKNILILLKAFIDASGYNIEDISKTLTHTILTKGKKKEVTNEYVVDYRLTKREIVFPPIHHNKGL